MEENNIRIDYIYDYIKNDFNKFKIEKKTNSINFYKSIIIYWNYYTKSGFYISCPRDLNLKKFLCEFCLINNYDCLFVLNHQINKINNFNDLYQNFYKSYICIVILNNLKHNLLKFYIKNKKKNVILSLETICKYKIVSNDILKVKHIIFI